MSPGYIDALGQTDYRLTPMATVLGAQILVVAFGALVLVSLLTGLGLGEAAWSRRV